MKKTHFVQILVVIGSGDFPLDMLRYDSACPDQEEDSSRVHDHEKRKIVLRRFMQESRGATEARWRSFGWHVLWQGNQETFRAERERILAASA